MTDWSQGEPPKVGTYAVAVCPNPSDPECVSTASFAFLRWDPDKGLCWPTTPEHWWSGPVENGV